MDWETLWEASLGLIIEDGWIAVGAVVAMLASWLVTLVGHTEHNEQVVDLAGPLLLGLIVVLILANLYAAGRSAAGKRLH